MSYELIWEDRGVLFQFWDVVSGDELVQSNLDVYADPRFESIECELVIFSDSVEFVASSESVRRVAKSVETDNFNVYNVDGVLARDKPNLVNLRSLAASKLQ